MATKDTVVQELVVNTLTHKQFKAAQEAGTLSPYELYGTPDTSVRLPVLTRKWFDHIVNDVSWLRADTFSWQSGDVYKAAYEHLVADSKCYAWRTSNGYCYSKSENPLGETVVHVDNDGAFLGYEKLVGSMGDGYVVNASGEQYTRETSADSTYAEVGVLTSTDTIGDITITYYKAEDGHKICLPNQENNVAALYEATGVAWYYILDTENKQFKLPRGKHNKYADTVPVVGNGMALGLTNGTNNLAISRASQNTNVYTDGYGTPVGTSPSAAINNTGTLGVTPDPEKSGIVAQQTQDTDQYKYLYFYVGNFEQDSVEQTAGINAEMFNGKADVNLMNTTSNVDFVVESQLPTADNGYTWYRKYKSGWVEQGGYVTGGGAGISVLLITPMADTKYQIGLTGFLQSGTAGNTTSVCDGQGAISTTSFYVNNYVENGSNRGNGVAFWWEVKGMAA